MFYTKSKQCCQTSIKTHILDFELRANKTKEIHFFEKQCFATNVLSLFIWYLQNKVTSLCYLVANFMSFNSEMPEASYLLLEN